MNEQEQLALREENHRQRQIITVLLEQNAQLKEDNSNILQKIEEIRTHPSFIGAESGILMTELSQISAKYRKYRKEDSNISDGTGKGGSYPSDFSPGTGNHGINPSQIKAALNKKNIQLLAAQVPYRGRTSGRKTIASILLHILNDGSGSHGTLAHLTRLTHSGIAKTIYYMKKRGLIQRTGFQKFSLTPLSLQWIEQAGIG